MFRNRTKGFARAAFAAGALATALGSAQPAYALNNINISITQVASTQGGIRCQVNFAVMATGVTNDFGGEDQYQPALVDSNNNGRGSTFGDSVTVGQTQTNAHVIVADGFGLIGQHSPTFVAVVEGASITGMEQIPDAALKAAGGRCLRFRENNEPDVEAGTGGQVQPNASVSLMGSASDFDNDALTIQWTQTAGPTVAINNDNSAANASFTAPARTNLVQTLTFELSADDTRDVSTDTVTYTIAANQAPTAVTGPDRTIPPTSTITLDGSGSSDPDNDPLTYSWSKISGPVVTLNNANSAMASFTSPARQATDQVFVFELTVDDGVAMDTDTVTLTLPANAPPVPNAGTDQIVVGGASVTLSGSATDPENDPITYSWTQVSGTPVTLAGATTTSPSFTAPPKAPNPQPLVFELGASDNQGNTATDTVTVTVVGNVGPTADAGADRTVTGNSAVTLDASASTDGDGDPITYSWAQTSGPAVTLSNANTAMASFTAPPQTATAQTLTFEVTVDDGYTPATDSVTITVAPNSAPVADAGPDRTVAGGAGVTLSGAGSSDADNDPLSYSWVQTSGPAVTLAGANSANASFTAPMSTGSVQTLTFELTVSDGVLSSADTVTVTVSPNGAPVAEAGPAQTVDGGDAVTLNGSASSDPDNDPLSYSWAQISGPSVALTGANTATPGFTAPAASGASQTLVFELTVSDGTASSTDTVTITVSPNGSPVAEAGASQSVAGGQAVTLDGSASSDPEGDPLSYSWTQTSGPAVTLTGANSAMAGFTAPSAANGAQTLVFQLTVSDGISSAADSVTVMVAPNTAPVADAGDPQAVAGGASVSLDGTGSSDGDGDPLSYSWTQTSGPAVTLTGANTAEPGFTAPAAQTSDAVLTFALTVSDGVATATASTTVTVQANSLPVADAGPNQGPIDTGQTVTLNGTGSTDPDGDPLTYQWTQVAGATAVLSDPTSATPSFTAPIINGYDELGFELVVNDGQADSDPDTVRIVVRTVGTITIVQNVIGPDATVTYSSDLAALDTSVTTSGGTAQIQAVDLTAQPYRLTVEDTGGEAYALTAIMCDDDDSVVDLASATVTMNLGLDEDLTCTITVSATQTAAMEGIRDFVGGRNAMLLANGPGNQRRIARVQQAAPAGGSASFEGAPLPGSGSLPLGLMTASGQTRIFTSLAMAGTIVDRDQAKFDVWLDATFSRVRFGEHEGDFRLVYIGADYLVRENVLVGGLVQFDDFDRDGGMSAAGAAQGSGWMVGPYVTARLAPRLYADARIAYGTSDNSISPYGGSIDSFDTERLLFSGSLIGDIDLGQSARLRPELSARYIRERQKAYIDAYSVSIPGQTIDQGEIAFDPRFDVSIAGRGGWIVRPHAGLQGVLTFGAGSNTVIDNGLRGRVEAGADILAPNGVRAAVGGFYDGIGEEDYEASGVRVDVSVTY